jgi:hypothetical protein
LKARATEFVSMPVKVVGRSTFADKFDLLMLDQGVVDSFNRLLMDSGGAFFCPRVQRLDLVKGLEIGEPPRRSREVPLHAQINERGD